MLKVKTNNCSTRRSLRRIRKKLAKEEDEKRMIPCSRRIRKKAAKEEDEKRMLSCSRRPRKKVAKEEEDKHRIPYIDFDVATNILSRIPADLLHKNFRHLSREWFHIISSPQFIDANTIHSKPGIIITWDDTQDDRTEVFFLEFEGLDLKVRKLNVFRAGITIMSSCNGLVLVQHGFHRDPVLFILNPTTKESVDIPQCGHKCLWHELVFLPITKEYKLVDMFYESSRETLAFHIRSISGFRNESYHVDDILKNVPVLDSYRDLDASLPWNERMSINGVVYVNLGQRKKIISFDVFNNMVQLLELPALGKAVRLIELSGTLAFVDCPGSCNGHVSEKCSPLDVWVLKDLNMGSWEKKFRIDALPEVLREQSYFGWYNVVGTVDNGQVFLFKTGLEIYAFDVKARRWKQVSVKAAAYVQCCPRFHVNSLVRIR